MDLPANTRITAVMLLKLYPEISLKDVEGFVKNGLLTPIQVGGGSYFDLNVFKFDDGSVSYVGREKPSEVLFDTNQIMILEMMYENLKVMRENFILSTGLIKINEPTKDENATPVGMSGLNSEEGPIDNKVKNPRKGRKRKFTDMECVRIYRQHYDENISWKDLATSYDWINSPFANNPCDETAISRIKEAAKHGRKLTPAHDRPTGDKTGRK